MNAPTIGPYKEGATLGQGQFGKVKEGEHIRTRAKVALKIVSPKKTDSEKVRHEIELQRRCEHPHVVAIFDVIDSDQGTVIAMELIPGGDLLECLMSSVRLQEDEARRLFQQLVAALLHCHSQGVAHRDVKPENVLLDAHRDVKLCDFGLAAEFREGEFLTDSVGSPNYAAPELLYKNCRYTGPEVDVWSSGCVLFALLCNNLPFDAADIPELFKKIKRGKYHVPGYVSLEAKGLVEQMLTVDPAQRTTLPQVLQNSWFIQSLPAGLCGQPKVAGATSSSSSGALVRGRCHTNSNMRLLADPSPKSIGVCP